MPWLRTGEVFDQRVAREDGIGQEGQVGNTSK